MITNANNMQTINRSMRESVLGVPKVFYIGKDIEVKPLGKPLMTQKEWLIFMAKKKAIYVGDKND